MPIQRLRFGTLQLVNAYKPCPVRQVVHFGFLILPAAFVFLTLCVLLPGSNKHQSAVTCLQFNSRFVVTSSDDGTVKLWDVKTGEFIRNLVSLDSGGSGGVVWRIRLVFKKLYIRKP